MKSVAVLSLVLFGTAFGKGVVGGTKRKDRQLFDAPICDNSKAPEERPTIYVREASVHHSCVVTNRGDEGAMVRVMCGGGDKPDKDVDRATYAYLHPQSKSLVLEGKCPSGHRCRICGFTMGNAKPGDDTNGQKFLEKQDYECSRYCRAVLYQHEDFNGHIQTFSHNAPKLEDTLMEGKISAVKIIGDHCQLRLYKTPGLENLACTINSGENMEVTLDMDDIQKTCGCHDCIESMSIREERKCGPAERSTGSEDCPICPKGKRDLTCCVKPKAHGTGVAREEALKRLFEAMAAVLKE